MHRILLLAVVWGMSAFCIAQNHVFRYDYWFDSDQLSGQSGQLTSGQNQIEISTATLSPSIHSLHVKLTDADGLSSSTVTSHFIKLPPIDLQARYWFDNDFSHAVEASARSGIIGIDASGLSNGIHTLHWQVQRNTYLHSRTEVFVKLEEEGSSSYSYWFDDDADNAHPLTIVNGLATIDASSLRDGIHTVSFSIDDGTKSIQSTGYVFIKIPQTEGAGSSLTCMLSIDGVLYEKIPVGSSGDVVQLTLDAEAISEGEHTLSAQLLTSSGAASPIYESTFYRITQEMDEADWKALQQLYQQLGSGHGWNHGWTLNDNPLSGFGLYGVKYKDGHVIAIAMPGNNITGSFPLAALQLQQLAELNLSNNHIVDSLGDHTSTTVMNPALRHLDLSHNQLRGNAAVVSQLAPSLTWLNLSYNHFETVKPRISQSIKADSLNLSHQQIDRQISLRELYNGRDNLLAIVPPILLYNHRLTGTDAFNSTLDMQLSAPDGWKASLVVSPGKWAVAGSGTSAVYHGTVGDIIEGTVSGDGHTARIVSAFNQGDVNFDFETDVVDLQRMINYVIDDGFTGVFNFSAANLWGDAAINIQDAVCMVNLLLETPLAQTKPHAMPRTSSSDEELGSYVFCHDGKLIISTEHEVAAFDIIVGNSQLNEVSTQLRAIGISCGTRQQGGQLHLVGYSLSGGSLPVGETVIATIKDANTPRVLQAKLVDRQANLLTASLNQVPTGLNLSTLHESGIVYKMPVGSTHSIAIDKQGNKRLLKEQQIRK